VSKASGCSERDADWTMIIRPVQAWFAVDLGELWRYRDLILLFVRRDFVAQYKQTVLGPLWFFIQPLLTTIMFTVVFGKIAQIPTDGVPQFIFYLSGTVCWGYFANCVTQTSGTFIANANILGKVYFPRLVIPISIVISNVFKFLIQFGLFLGFLVYFMLAGSSVALNWGAMFLPLLIAQMAVMGLGFGIVISSLTTRWRDLTLLVAFGVQLWMYATPVVYPLSQIPEQYRAVYALNPMVAIVESFRQIFLGTSSVTPQIVATSLAVTLVLLFAGLVLFSRVEKTFMDTI